MHVATLQVMRVRSVVCNQNLVSVTVLAESVGIGAEIFFSETETFFSNFTHFFLILGGVLVLRSFKVNLALQKILKVANVCKKIWI